MTILTRKRVLEELRREADSAGLIYLPRVVQALGPESKGILRHLINEGQVEARPVSQGDIPNELQRYALRGPQGSRIGYGRLLVSGGRKASSKSAIASGPTTRKAGASMATRKKTAKKTTKKKATVRRKKAPKKIGQKTTSDVLQKVNATMGRMNKQHKKTVAAARKEAKKRRELEKKLKAEKKKTAAARKAVKACAASKAPAKKTKKKASKKRTTKKASKKRTTKKAPTRTTKKTVRKAAVKKAPTRTTKKAAKKSRKKAPASGGRTVSDSELGLTGTKAPKLHGKGRKVRVTWVCAGTKRTGCGGGKGGGHVLGNLTDVTAVRVRGGYPGP